MRVLSGLVLLLLALAMSSGFAQKANSSKPDFAGTWSLDRARSFGLPRDMQQTMNVTQVGDRIELETKLVTAQGENTISDSYTIDGAERDFTPQGPRGPIEGSTGKRKANWLPNGRGIVVEEETKTQTPNGLTSGRLTRKWTILNDGELVIDLYIDDQRGSYEMKRTFVKK